MVMVLHCELTGRVSYGVSRKRKTRLEIPRGAPRQGLNAVREREREMLRKAVAGPRRKSHGPVKEKWL